MTRRPGLVRLSIIVAMAWVAVMTRAGTAHGQGAPPTIREVWGRRPAHVETTVLRGYRQGRIRIEEITYASEVKGQPPSCIFAYFCRPETPARRLPALLVVHGGGGTADLESACTWASAGYAVLAIDLPGKGLKREGSRSTGPDMDLDNLFRILPDAHCNYLVHATAAARDGITVLAERREVDAGRLGMVGLSWGGVITLLTNGQDRRLKAAVNVFGSGFIPEGCTWQQRFTSMNRLERLLWDRCFDPQSFLAGQHAPMLFMTGTNDHCFYLPTFQKSYAATPVQRDLLIRSNARHLFSGHDRRTVLKWFDYRLRGEGSWPRVAMQRPFDDVTGATWLQVKIDSATPVRTVSLLLARGAPRAWTTLEWRRIPCTQSSRSRGKTTTWIVRIPKPLPDPEILCYLAAVDASGRCATTEVHSLMRVDLGKAGRTCALSGPIRAINSHPPPFTLTRTGDVVQQRLIVDARKGAFVIPGRTAARRAGGRVSASPMPARVDGARVKRR